jgi:dihydroorotate dehydrogenase (fumarate)
MVASVLYKKGFAQIGTILKETAAWMDEKEYESVEQLKGSMSRENCPDPSAFQRGNYMKALTTFTGMPI